jgi:hypothetical protein
VNPEYQSTPVPDIKVGDIISVNTGYRPLDDEDCKVLKIEEGVSLFDDPERRFFIDSNNAGKHWYHCNLNHTVLKELYRH